MIQIYATERRPKNESGIWYVPTWSSSGNVIPAQFKKRAFFKKKKDI